MNVKRFFGVLLTLLGIGSLIYAAMDFIKNSTDVRSMIVFGVLGLIFFVTGIGLIRGISDTAR